MYVAGSLSKLLQTNSLGIMSPTLMAPSPCFTGTFCSSSITTISPFSTLSNRPSSTPFRTSSLPPMNFPSSHTFAAFAFLQKGQPDLPKRATPSAPAVAMAASTAAGAFTSTPAADMRSADAAAGRLRRTGATCIGGDRPGAVTAPRRGAVGAKAAHPPLRAATVAAARPSLISRVLGAFLENYDRGNLEIIQKHAPRRARH